MFDQRWVLLLNTQTNVFKFLHHLRQLEIGNSVSVLNVHLDDFLVTGQELTVEQLQVLVVHLLVEHQVGRVVLVQLQLNLVQLWAVDGLVE